MLKVISINVNGIRAAARKGMFEWLQRVKPDVVCLQELKAQAADINSDTFQLPGYHAYYQFAQKKGYSGVGIYTRHKPDEVEIGLDWPLSDDEGRHVSVRIGKLWVTSLYLPSGTSGDERQAVKYAFLDFYEAYLKKIRQQQTEHIICGDWNIAHKQIDLKNWRGNQKNSGFLPEERAWMDKVFDELGFVDAFRVVNQEPDQYTWWSARGRAWDNNVGWRIDYQITTPGLKPTIKSASIYKDQRFSDHAPLLMEYDIIP